MFMYPSQILRLPDVLLRVGVRRSTLYALIAAKRFPAPVKLTDSGRAVGWPSSAVEAWIASRIERQECGK